MFANTANAWWPGAAGEPDLSFGDSGKAAVIMHGVDSCQVNGLALCPDGGLLVAAKVYRGRTTGLGLARLDAKGSLDQRFGRAGAVVDCFEGQGDAMADKVIQLPDGRILLVGLHYECRHQLLPALAMFHPDGQLDPGFGDAGKQVVRLPGGLSSGTRDTWLPPGIPGAEACAACVQPDGRILLVANHSFELANHTGLLIRLEPDGRLDTTFNGRGFVMVRRLLLSTWLSSVHLQSDGAIVVAGSIDFPQQALLARYRADGSLDETFAEQGFARISAQGRNAHFSQVIQCRDGRLHGVGSSREPIHAMALAVDADGEADPAFNHGQPSLTAIVGSPCQWQAVAEQGDGKLVMAGATIGGFTADFVVARHLADGSPDPTFASGRGWVRTRLGRSVDTATALVLQPDGKILLAGHGRDGAFRGVVTRYHG
ncbi:hypothetical protein FQ186_23985 [Pseudomonas sp. ANT_H14]|uniref:hypothetical protein n=1 Tax=unclassified Pseudomonas TaxID=196821 RepID=UPI0011EE69F8|nr:MULTISPECIES: hypothetical protein [unclassified Pseudomonas]KAA0942534.1 hypothetical protein FQ182_27255 [Pseudomonas sp. ANT_H4]KAA0948022.1 hypothetical protein FQ186_23985 [Pseudomonas sp. ANT_H14]